MFNFLAGSVVQLVLFILFDHKTDAFVFGCLLVFLLSLKHFGLIAFTRYKAIKAVASKQSFKRRELL